MRRTTIVLRLSYRMGATHQESEGRGETMVAAHAALRTRLVEDRLGIAFRAMIECDTRG